MRARRVAQIVTALYFVAALIVFRDVLLSIPGVLAGRDVIVGDELVPFFNWHSQLIDQAAGEFNDLTNGYEFRVRYSFLTTWFRYAPVLPFAILVVIPAIFALAYRVVVWFVTDVFRSLSPVTVALVSAFPVSLVYMIATYAKATHFYTLLLGLMMMTAAMLLMLHGLLFARTRWVRAFVGACVLVLLNPAVHYLVLFSVFFLVAALTLLLGEFARWVREGGVGRLRSLPTRLRTLARGARPFVTTPGRRIRIRTLLRRAGATTIGRGVVAGALVLFLVLIPYQLFVQLVALRGVSNLSETVPGDYYFIRDASVSWLHMLSWDLAGIMDKVLYGDYLAKIPRVTNLVYSALFFAPFALPVIRRSLLPTRAHRQLFGVILVVSLFAMWATIGYAEPSWFPTFHRTLSAVTNTLYGTHSTVGNLTLDVASTVVQVLRFPHRFQLLLFALAPLMMSLMLAWSVVALQALVRRRRPADAAARELAGVRVAVVVLLVSSFFLPFWANPNYRQVFGSGDFGTFLAPYPLRDLADLKEHIRALPEGKTIVLPPTETAKLVTDDNGVDHKFIDKFFIYYLDQPSYYYGLTGDSFNKFVFFLILRGIYYQQDWWIVPARDAGIRYVVVNKRLRDNRGVGAEYLPDVENYTAPAMQRQAQLGQMRSVYENDSYLLYEILDQPRADRKTIVIDASWRDYLRLVWNRLDLTRCYRFAYLPFVKPGDIDADTLVYASDVQAASVDVWAARHRDAFFVPSPKIFPFNPDIVASSYYLSPMFREFLLFSNTKWNRTELITPGVVGTLAGSFIGVPRATEFTLPVRLPAAGTYRLLLRTAATANSLTVQSSTLGLDATLDVRSSPEGLQYFSADTIYTPDRVAVDTRTMTAAQLGERLDDGLVPVNLLDEYQDVGTVTAAAGSHSITVTKNDDNQMLVEGLLVVPEEEYRALAPDDTFITSPAQLECAATYPVMEAGDADYVDPAANGPHADLSQEELLSLAAAGVDTLEPDTSGGTGPSWVVISLAAAVALAAVHILRSHMRARPPTGTRDTPRDKDGDHD